MEKYKRYYGLIIFIATVVVLLGIGYALIKPKYDEKVTLEATVAKKEAILKEKKTAQANVMNKLKKLKNSIMNLQKKIYSPSESYGENDTLFFTLYNDVIEMVHANSVKIKSIDYEYNPKSDAFVKFGRDAYFVCDVNMDLVSNYVNLGKLIQDIYQYPYYIKFNEISIKPYEKDKTILVTSLSLRLYAHTQAEEVETSTVDVDAPLKLGQ